MKRLCELCNMSKQNYYKGVRKRKKREIDEDFILELVRGVRRMHPNMGGRKLLHIITPEMADAGVFIGRNRFFDLLKAHDMQVPKKRRYAKTTNSKHPFNVYRNELQKVTIDGIYQALVADLTYIRTNQSFVYLALVMDVYSRKIVGFDVDNRLEASGCMRALKMALGQVPDGKQIIHHSDRGVQYCCYGYTDLLKERDAIISMTEENHCYENAKAERLNGILKQEYGLGATLSGLGEAKRLVREAVDLYNNHRPHFALSLETPGAVHDGVALAI